MSETYEHTCGTCKQTFTDEYKVGWTCRPCATDKLFADCAKWGAD